MIDEAIFNILESYPSFNDYVFIENLKDRKLILNEEITDDIVEKIIMQIIKFNKEDKDIPIEKRKPIKLYINTNGGDIEIGLVLCNVIKSSKTPVYGIALGKCYSMGGLILIACHKRFAYPFSAILIHDGSVVVQASTKKAKQAMDFYSGMERKTKEFILQNTKITEEKYNEMYGEEWYMLADEALKWGVIDEIIGSDTFES